MNKKTPPTKDPNTSNVVSIFDRDAFDEIEYEPNDADLQGFLRILSHIQAQSSIGECEIKVDFDAVTITVHTTETDPESGHEECEDIRRYHLFSYRSVADVYLPMMHENLPIDEKVEYMEMLTSTIELAIESITLDLPDDEDDE